MPQNPKERLGLTDLEALFQEKWKLEQRLGEVTTRIAELWDLAIDLNATPSISTHNSGINNAVDTAPRTLPERIVNYLRNKKRAHVQDIIAEVGPDDGNAVRSALSRLVSKGELVQQLKNENGSPLRGVYVYVGGE